MPAYKPYSGGSPAMYANATPCVTNIIEPVSPANRSDLKVSLLTKGHQLRNGKKVFKRSLFKPGLFYIKGVFFRP